MKDGLNLQSIHPFPARMASDIALKELVASKRSLRVLDPMMGSGTTLAVARSTQNIGIGFDTDPLALLMSKTWCSDFSNEKGVLSEAEDLLIVAKKSVENISAENAYPENADDETKKFVEFWFDENSRKELTALSRVINKVKNAKKRNLYWCAFSRMIITKKNGVSLAMDVSHSRPHKTYDLAPVAPFNFFIRQLKTVIRRMPFKTEEMENELEKVVIKKGDARKLPLENNSIDMVITSPPYLNAIDYLRGHKLSLVWMGHKISDLRDLRSTNIGATKKIKDQMNSNLELLKFYGMEELEVLTENQIGILKRYIFDMDKVVTEIERVLVNEGKAIFVIGDCNFGDIFVSNSKIITNIAKLKGLKLISRITRPLPDNKRYLPPPTHSSSGKSLQKRMREEVILSLCKN